MCAGAHLLSPFLASASPTVRIHTDQVKGQVSPTLHGLMTEEINFSFEGGLYGELIRNRSFKASTYEPRFWSPVGGAVCYIDPDFTLNRALNTSVKINAPAASPATPAGIANPGYWGIPVRPRTTYRGSFYARADGAFTGPLTATLRSSDGSNVFATATLTGFTNDWKKYEFTLTTGDVPPSKHNQFTITTSHPGAFWLQQVSLFPPTFNGRTNGTRPDLMQLLANMKPGFLRFPGGNYLEGYEIENRFQWKNTIGPVEERPGHYNDGWFSWSTDGFGLKEFLDWCEDLSMEPVLGLYAGYSMRQRVVQPGPDLAPYVQDALDEIEYVIGDTNTTWGARRARDGRPEPYRLRYVEVGNEDYADKSGSYEGRFAQFFDAIRAKYPQLQIIASSPVKSRVPDVVDHHAYPEWPEAAQIASAGLDKYDRKGPKIFIGEWATGSDFPTPDLAGALGDAAWMTGLERNSDIIIMACYAPLFVNVSDTTTPRELGGSLHWYPNLIGYDALNSYGSPSYHAICLFRHHLGDQIIATELVDIPTKTWTPPTQSRFWWRKPPAPGVRTLPSLFFSTTRESKTGRLFIKAVNTVSTPQTVTFDITGASTVDPNGTAIVLTSEKPTDTNSLEHPKRVTPVSQPITGLAPTFTRTLPPHSITVLEIQCK